MNTMTLNIPKQEEVRNFAPRKFNDYILSIVKAQTKQISTNFSESTDKIKGMAKAIYEHFAIVEESRKAIKKGNIISWDEYTNKFKIKKILK